MVRWGIDMGGTKIECVVIDSDQQILFRDRVHTEADRGYEHILNQFITLVRHSVKSTGISPQSIGICAPGSIDTNTGLVKNSNTTALNNMPFKEDLERVLKVPLCMENDANCFTLAEHHMGAVKDNYPESLLTFGVILGTGVGGGIVHQNTLISGLNGIAGEWGHNYLDGSGGLCYCGKTGCVETVISGPALERYYTKISGLQWSLKEIYQSHKTGKNIHASKTISRLIEFFALGMSQVINILDPDVIVIGGGVGNIDLIYTEGLERVKQHIFSPTAKCRILKPKLGDSAGVFGAAFLDTPA